MKHKNTQPLYIFNRENPQKSEPQNGLRRGLDFIALIFSDLNFTQIWYWNIARLEVIIDNSSVKWDGRFIEFGFDDQTRLHCGYNCDHKLSKGNLGIFL